MSEKKLMLIPLVFIFLFFPASFICHKFITTDVNKKLNHYYEKNYTFTYKQQKLSKLETEDLLNTVKWENYQLEHKKEAKNYAVYAYVINDKKYMCFMIKKREKKVFACIIQNGRKDYMTLQLALQLGYKISYNKKFYLDKDIEKILQKVDKNEDCIVSYDDEKKIAKVID